MNRCGKITEDELHDILSYVEKPSRYIGGERGSVYKEFEKSSARIAFAFPDVYEIGSGNMGQEILYHRVNSVRRYLGERVFAPWDDFEKKMKEQEVPLMTLESHTAVKDFDLLAFTVSYELGYSGMFTIMNSSRLPLRSSERVFPLVAMGGACAFNGLVMSDYVDFFHLGDGEIVIGEIADILSRYRDQIDENRQDIGLKRTILEEISELQGIYVPFIGKKSKSRAILKSLAEDYYPMKAIIPYSGDMKNRVTLEVFRGCTQGCRFCQAGYIYRPYRKKTLTRLLELVHGAFSHSGHSEVSLSSLNTTDYPELGELVKSIIEIRRNKPLKISIPSSRISSFDEDFAGTIRPYSSGSLTLALEAGTERLRRVINKHTSDDEINRTVRGALSNGFGELKLYFMIGLPTETKNDLEGILDQVENVRHIYADLKRNGEIKAKTNFQVKVSVSNFVPKAHTPFQWFGMNSIEELKEKQGILRNLKGMRSLKASFHSTEASYLEGILSRGDDKVGRVIERAWKMGSRFESWRERLDINLWRKAFDDEGIDPEKYIRERDLESDLPWDALPSGIDKNFLIREYKKALSEEETRDCFENECAGCGLWNDICSGLPRGK